MYYAIDKDGKRVHIDNAHSMNDYFCPICGLKLVLKRGPVISHHFSHLINQACVDKYHYDMSEWHEALQNLFPDNTREYVLSNGIKSHRADVFIEKKNTVLEFQHSSLSSIEFSDRCDFYTSFGYNLVWIFDLREEAKENKIYNYKENLYRWLNPKRTFNNYLPSKNKNIELYFELENDKMVKIIWAPKDGFERFMTDTSIYNRKYFVNRFLKKEIIKLVPLRDLKDRIKESYKVDGISYYLGCPKTNNHVATLNECIECDYYQGYKDDYILCNKRFIDLNIDLHTLVEIKKITNGYITEIKIDDNIYEIESYPKRQKKDLFSLWNDKYKYMIVKNMETLKYYLITSNPKSQFEKYNRVYGKVSNDSENFSEKSSEIIDVEREIWILFSKKKKIKSHNS